ncbi:MAG: hypothetical protein V5A68_07380, partial [Candidatus Thermoplasmatota archaeon]
MGECGGFIATGSVCSGNRSVFMKNRHGSLDVMKPFYYEGNNFSFIAFGRYHKDDGRPYCRMGINEKGLAIGNFDQSGFLSSGNREYVSDNSSHSEDYDMWYVLGNYETVGGAANWLVHHASYPCEWGIVSREEGVGAVVAMDSGYNGNISWVNDSYTALGNQWYCEDEMDSQMVRTQYLADRMYSDDSVISVEEVGLNLSKDINAS